MRLSWARLFKRVFELDLKHCSNGGGELRIIAAILERPVIEKIFTYLATVDHKDRSLSLD
jgi:hypothetical protein